MSRLSDVSNAAIRKLIGTYNSIKGILAINAGSAATIKTTSAALVYVINGVFYTAAAWAAQAITVTNGPVNGLGYVQPAGTTVYYTLGLNAAGTICVVQGTYAGQSLNQLNPTLGVGGGYAGAQRVGDGSMPLVPADYCPIGIIKVVTDSSHTFTAGTTALDATGVTASYFDVAVMPEGNL